MYIYIYIHIYHGMWISCPHPAVILPNTAKFKLFHVYADPHWIRPAFLSSVRQNDEVSHHPAQNGGLFVCPVLSQLAWPWPDPTQLDPVSWICQLAMCEIPSIFQVLARTMFSCSNNMASKSLWFFPCHHACDGAPHESSIAGTGVTSPPAQKWFFL